MESNTEILKKEVANFEFGEEVFLIETENLDSTKIILERMQLKYTVIISVLHKYYISIPLKQIKEADIKKLLGSTPLNVYLLHRKHLLKLTDGVWHYAKIFKLTNKNIRIDTEIYVDINDQMLMGELKKYSQYTIEAMPVEITKEIIQNGEKLINLLHKIELRR